MEIHQSLTLYLVTCLFIVYKICNHILLYFRRRRMMKLHNCQPCLSTYNKDPFLGLDVVFETARNSKNQNTLAGNHARFLSLDTKTFRSRIVNIPIIATCEPENIKTILSLKFDDYDFGSRKKAFMALLGDGIFNSDGCVWKRSRGLLRPQFGRDQVAAEFQSFEKHMQLLLARIPKDWQTVDLQQLFFKFSLDVATEFLFGRSTATLSKAEDDSDDEDMAFGQAFAYAQQDIMTRLRLSFFDRLRPNKQGKAAIRVCHAYIDRFVDEALQWRKSWEASEAQGGAGDDSATTGDGRYVFIRELAKQTDDRLRIRNEAVNILLAGRDSTASLLGNLWFELAKRPEIYDRLKKEVATLQGRHPKYEELKELKYLRWCMNESLRLLPIVPGNIRHAIRDTVLPLGGGPLGQSPLFVPAGTTVGYSPYALHRRTDIYGADAAAFRPERWRALRPGWGYLPFNGGPRICLGQQYALAEVGYVTCRLLQEFETCKSRDENGSVWVEQVTITCCSGNGAKVALTPTQRN